jgi:hypothetical protein
LGVQQTDRLKLAGGLELLGFCGVYCGACTTYRACRDNDQSLVEWIVGRGMPREEIFCEGCRSSHVNKWCSECRFRSCVEGKGLENCFQRGSFPCSMLVNFSKTRPHRVLGLRNLHKLREASLNEWLRGQERRWACPSCGKKQHWYAEKCLTCGAELVTATEEAYP